MENNTYLRKVDALGRVSLPKDVRELLGAKPGTAIQFEILGDKVLFKCSTPNSQLGID